MPELSSNYPMTILHTDTAVNRRTENKKVRVSLTWQKTGLSPVSKSKIDHPPLRRAQGTFPLLSQWPPAVRWNALSAWWNEMYNQRYAFKITSLWQTCQGQEDNESIMLQVKALSFHCDHKPQKGQEWPTQHLPQIHSWSNHLILQTASPVCTSFQTKKQIQEPVLELLWINSRPKMVGATTIIHRCHQQFSLLVSFTVFFGSNCLGGSKFQKIYIWLTCVTLLGCFTDVDKDTWWQSYDSLL